MFTFATILKLAEKVLQGPPTANPLQISSSEEGWHLLKSISLIKKSERY